MISAALDYIRLSGSFDDVDIEYFQAWITPRFGEKLT